MQEKQQAGNCRWAMPTLFVPFPIWLEAEDFAWTCTRDAEPHPLLTTEPCENCPRWEEDEVLARIDKERA
jgi:hypothetical protein